MKWGAAPLAEACTVSGNSGEKSALQGSARTRYSQVPDALYGELPPRCTVVNADGGGGQV